MNDGRLSIFLIVCIGILTYFLIPPIGTWFGDEAANENLVNIEEMPNTQPDSLSMQPPPELSREEKAARKALRDLALEEGSIGDKMLNFLLSEKRDYYREVYEIKHNIFENNNTPSPKLQTELIHLSDIMKAYPGLKIEIVSHTGQNLDWQAQQDLTEKRAKALQTFLVNTGVDELRIYASGYGAASPLADNSTERGRQMNERTEILIKGL